MRLKNHSVFIFALSGFGMSNICDVNEERRLRSLYNLNVLDTPQERAFDRFTELCMRLFEVPIVLVSLVDANRQWFKSSQGVEADETPRSHSICSYAIQQSDVMVIKDTLLDARIKDSPLVTGEPKIRFYAGAPLILSGSDRIGTLCLIDKKPRDISSESIAVLEKIAASIVDEFKLKNLVDTDGFTGALTRRALYDRVTLEVNKCKSRTDRQFSVLVFDIDGLGIVNADYGRTIGDAVLLRSVEVCRALLRSYDVFGRVSGDRFAILLQDCDIAAARLVAERLRRNIIKASIHHSTGPIEFSASFGAAQYSVFDITGSTLLERAETALRRAKAEGRNQTACSAEPSTGAPNWSDILN